MNEPLTALDASPITQLQIGLHQSALELTLEQALARQDEVYAQWQLTVSKPRPKALSIAHPSEKIKRKNSFMQFLVSIF